MRRFFVKSIPESDTIYLCDAAQLHHLKNVLRLRVGDEIVLFDATGNECSCSIVRLSGKEAVLVVKERKVRKIAKIALTLACATPKRGRMDDIVDKLTQLGVDTIIPMHTARVVGKLDEQGCEVRLERWQRLATAAAEQSQRSKVPVIAPITEIEDVISMTERFDLKLVATLFGDRKSIVEVLEGHVPGNILVMIGPEGDFTPDEVRLVLNAGFVPVSLGLHVLRVETAAIAVASYISLSLDL